MTRDPISNGHNDDLRLMADLPVTLNPHECVFNEQFIAIDDSRSPASTVGRNVNVGAGAKFLGALRVGDSANIGATAVVLCDVPAGALAVGVPARIVMRSAVGETEG